MAVRAARREDCRDFCPAPAAVRKTWSDEFVLRRDAGSSDLGYPVVAQLDDGRVFVAYYYNLGEYLSATRFIAGTFFRMN